MLSLFQEAPVFTELSRENDEEKGSLNFPSLFFVHLDAFVLSLPKASSVSENKIFTLSVTMLLSLK